MATIVFSNQKGGTGKTTLSLLFAYWLVEKRGQRVCFIDLDSQCNASKTLQSFAHPVSAVSLFDAAAGELPQEGTLVLIPGSKALVDVERAQPGEAISSFVEHLSSLKSSFDAVVIDTPPALGLRMSAALIAADQVVCPIELEEYSIDGVTDMLKTVFGVRQKYNPALRLAGIVANRFNPHSARQRAALAELITEYDQFIVPAKISTRSSIPEALAARMPVWRLPKSAAREASAELLNVFELLGARMGLAEPASAEVAS